MAWYQHFIQGHLKAARYRYRVLVPRVVPLVQRHQLTYQQDNARPHVARVWRDHMVANNAPTLDWSHTVLTSPR